MNNPEHECFWIMRRYNKRPQIWNEIKNTATQNDVIRHFRFGIWFNVKLKVYASFVPVSSKYCILLI